MNGKDDRAISVYFWQHCVDVADAIRRARFVELILPRETCGEVEAIAYFIA